MKTKMLSARMFIAVMISLAVTVILSVFSVNAAGEIYTESEGVRTAYLSNSETVTLPAGDTRNTYATLSEALLALGEDGGRVYVCGEVTDNTEAKAFVDVIRTSPVVVTGLPGDGADDILNYACTLTMGGNFTFDNFKLNCTISGGTYIFGGPGVKVFGENFTTGGTVYYKNYGTGLNYDNAYTKTVFNTSAEFVQLCVGGDTKDLGTATATEPATAEVEVNNITLNASSIDMGYHNWNNNMYGNVNLIVNGGTFTKGKKIVMDKVLSVTGKTTAIFNNGTRSGVTFTYSPDYIVDSAVGGMVSVKTQAPFGGAPTFEFTPDDRLFPMVDGILIPQNADGEYLYTPDTYDSSKTISVTWTDLTTPGIYNENGERTAYLASTETVTLGDGTTRIPYATLSDALLALGENGGKLYICGEVTDATEAKGFIDVVRTSPVVVTGLPDDGADDILNFGCTLTMGGNFTFDNFKLNCTLSGGVYILGGPGVKVFGDNFTTGGTIYYKNYGSGLNYDNAYAKTVFNSDATFVQLCVGGDTGDLGTETATEPATAEVEINNITLNATSIEMGYHNWNNNMYGNVNLVVNGGSFPKGKKIVMTKVKSVTGKTTAIFNNGTRSGFTFTYAPNYIIDSAVGGTVSIKTQAALGGAPTFEFTPQNGTIPMVNGEWLIPDNSGKYYYTPAVSDSSQTIVVNWDDAFYKMNGKNCTFVKANGGTVSYNGGEYFAYSDINTANAALGENGGYILIAGTVQFVNNAKTTENVFVDIEGRSPLYIEGIDGTSAQINYYSSMDLKGDLIIDNITYHRLDGTLWDTGFYTNGYDLTLGESFVTTSNFASQVMTIHGANTSTSFNESTINIHNGTVTRLAPGSTYFGITVSGDTEINLYGGTFGTLLGGSHGGANSDSIYNGDVTYNIYGGSISNIYTGVNVKTGVNGNVVVNIDGGTFNDAKLLHGNVSDKTSNYLNGNSVYVITGGNFTSASFGDGNSRGVTGEEIFVVSKDVTGYTHKGSSKGTFIKYDTDGTVEPVFETDGTFAGYKILCEDTALDIVIDGVYYERTDDDIYTIERGTHDVEFAKKRNVTFDLNGGEGTAPEVVGAYAGVDIGLPSTDAYYRHHTFIGWNTDKTSEMGFMTYELPDEDVTLYAIWSEIKPALSDISDIENSGASVIKVTSVAESEYDTHSSVKACFEYALSDGLLVGGGEVIYAFSVRAFDENGASVSAYDSTMEFVIPKALLAERNGMQFYRIYKAETSEEVSLMSENITAISYTEDDNNLYFKDYTVGDYAVVLASEYGARYIYRGSYNGTSKKYTLDLYFDDADACYGTFGLKYDTSLFTLDSFVFDDAVVEYGNIPVDDGGFETYYYADGIYQNTWKSDTGVFASGEVGAVKIGTFTFTVSDCFTEISDISFVCASFDDTGIVLTNSILETVWQNGKYLYAPMVPSSEVYCQATDTVFEFEQSKSVVTASFVLARESTNSYVFDNETGVNNAAIIKIMNGETEIIVTSEIDCIISENQDGKAIIEFNTVLSEGTYKIIFTKNGYSEYTGEFAVEGTSVSLGIITPVCGDIKAEFDDVCGDGVVDIDDFIRVLRGFASNSTKVLRQTVDINEDGVVSVQDIAYIKTNFGK